MLPDVAVPTYDQANASLAPVYDPQVSQVNSEIAQLQPQQDAQQASLDQAKVNAFRDITTAANNKGMLFSGFSPDQQAQYIGTKYLPAVANLKATFQNNRNTLLDKINAINAQRATQAQGIVSSSQTAAANTAYKNAQLAIAQQRLAISAAKTGGGSSSSSRSSSGSSGGSTKTSSKSSSTSPMTTQQLSAAIRTGLNGVRGKDGYVAPQDYALAFKDWTTAGNSASTFDKYFGDLKNPKNGYYDYAKTQV